MLTRLPVAMEPAQGSFAAKSRHDRLCTLESVCLTLKLRQLKETNPSHGPDS
jgi:hypothetical protein